MFLAQVPIFRDFYFFDTLNRIHGAGVMTIAALPKIGFLYPYAICRVPRANSNLLVSNFPGVSIWLKRLLRGGSIITPKSSYPRQPQSLLIPIFWKDKP
uniref:Uncharacterized protein n=1 Tax=Candidatus Kentrum sp. LPFa TaxID=2126335 RepID=A0A450W4C2_9GAMM|nr:MAG: hypothetical protein BECKLPF1236A_GA0070988_100613 [Candidatus Kentron sp. LPFa]VFK28051.1 MAG: hypothetical protein BECKLPF1236C_GA0070990_100573 [Candidatus Kentron sp. LPFa]